MEFARREYFWLLWVIPFAAILWWMGVWHQRRMRDRFGNLANLENISRISWSARGWARGILFVSSLTLLVLGLAQPRMVTREMRPVPTPTDMVFLVDISPSMYARDMDPTRLGRAEQIIQKFLFLKQPQDRYALVTFNYTSIVLSYLTNDPQSILVYFDYLNQQDQPELGTNMGTAMTSGLRVFDVAAKFLPETAKGRRRVFVLISDGDDNIGQWAAPLREVIKQGVVVYTFGLGSANGAAVPLLMAGGLNGEVVKYLTREGGSRIISRAESRTMREISEKTGGHFFRGEDNQQLDRALDELLFEGRPVAGYVANPIRQDLYFYFLMAAFACLLVGIFL